MIFGSNFSTASGPGRSRVPARQRGASCYQVEIAVRGNNDKTASVDTVWQVEPDGETLRFLTVRTIEKDR